MQTGRNPRGVRSCSLVEAPGRPSEVALLNLAEESLDGAREGVEVECETVLARGLREGLDFQGFGGGDEVVGVGVRRVGHDEGYAFSHGGMWSGGAVECLWSCEARELGSWKVSRRRAPLRCTLHKATIPAVSAASEIL